MQQRLHTLCAAPGTPGCEHPAAAVAAQLLSQYCETRIDPLGNVIGEKRGPGPHILLDAHLDQVGMAVTAIEDGGFLRIANIGSMDLRVLAAQEVTVYGKEPVYGVVPAMPPHLSKESNEAPEWDSLCIDTGLSKDQAEALIPLGSRVTLRTPPAKLLGERFSAPALDNRAGMAAVLRCMELLADTPCHVTALFSVQEESGGGGAGAAGFACEPDCAVVVDVSFAAAPGIDPLKAQGKLGGGVMIGIAPGLDYEMGEILLRLAEEQGLPFAREIMGGRTGTNAERLQSAGRGVPCALLSVPLRNMHTGVEVVAMWDIEATARLLAAFVKEKGGAA